MKVLRRSVHGIVFAACSAYTVSALADAQAVFDGYRAYYRTLAQPVFLMSDERPLRKATAPSGRVGPFWSGVSGPGGTRHTVEMLGADLVIDGRRLQADRVQKFPGAFASALGDRATLYANDDFVCVEGVAPSASGTASRHTQVTLVTQPYARSASRFELPSLFASCLGLHRGEQGQVLFYQASYRYARGRDEADGVIFSEFALESGAFRKTDRTVYTTFVEAGNVYRFSVASPTEK